MTAKRSWKNPGQDRWDEDLVVTPEIATYWIEQCRYADQRVITQSKVDEYCRMRQLDMWDQDNESPIKIDIKGEVIDGNHRLWMVLQTGLPTRFHIHYNVPTAVYYVTDTGVPRSLKHVGIPEFRDAKSAAISRSLALGPSTAVGQALAKNLPLMREFQEQHQEAIAFARRVCPVGNRGVNATVAGAVARAFYHVEHIELVLFCDRLKTRVIDQAGEVAPLLLLDWLTSPRKRSVRMSVMRETYLKTARAIQLFEKREQIMRLHAAAEDPYPLPR